MTDYGRDPEIVRLIDRFRFAHLEAGEQQIAGPCAGLAQLMANTLVDSEELAAGLEYLWRARVWFTRAERQRR